MFNNNNIYFLYFITVKLFHFFLGEIRTRVPLDRETKDYFEIVVMAKDSGGRSGFTTVSVTVIDINDNSPQFLSPRFSTAMYSNASSTTPVLQVFKNFSNIFNL